MNDLTDTEQEFYDSNGYLVFRAMSTDEAEQLYAFLLTLADEDFSPYLNLDREHARVREVMCDPRIVSVVEEIHGRPIVGLMSQMLYKHVGSRFSEQAWNPHQDNAYPQARRGMYTTVNIFLQDADPANGGMYLYPGSHREPLLPFESVRSFREDKGDNPGLKVRVPKNYERYDLCIKQGEALVLHGHLIHGSYANTSLTRSRPLLSFSYIPENEDFISGDTAKRIPISLR